MGGKITRSPVRPGIIGNMGTLEDVQKTFYVCIQDLTSCPVGFEGPKQFGDAGGRFTRLGHGGMNKNHARLKRKMQNLTRKFTKYSTACNLRYPFFGETRFRQSHSQSTPP